MPATILNQQSITFWPTAEAAQRVADANRADDPECEYHVAPTPCERWAVAIIDPVAVKLLGYL